METKHRNLWIGLAALAAGLCLAVGLVSAERFVGRLLPEGKATLYRGDRSVGEFTSEAPLPQDTWIVCEKRCGVKTASLMMVAEDGTAFSLSEEESELKIAVRKGTIHFAAAALDRPTVFETPDASVTAVGLLLNASAGEKLLRGYVKAEKGGSELGVIEGGSMLVNAAGREQTVAAGDKLLLAQVPPKGQAEKKEDDDDDERFGILFGMSGEELTALGIQGTAAIAAVFAVDDDSEPASPSAPPVR